MLNTLGKSRWMILFSSNLTFNEYLRQEKVEYLENSVAQLSYDEKNEYFKLHDCKCLPGKIKEMQEEEKRQSQFIVQDQRNLQKEYSEPIILPLDP